MKNKETIKIALFWHNFPSENLGVGALTETNISTIKEAIQNKNIQFVCVGTMPESMEKIASLGVPVKYYQGSLRKFIKNPKYFMEMASSIGECKLALDLGEGDSFSDIYGYKRLFQQSIPKIISIYKKIPLILSPQTIGPFRSFLGKRTASFILSKAFAVFARDRISAELVTKITPSSASKKLTQTSDLAFNLKYSPLKEPPVSSKLRVGINISGLLYNGGYSSKNEFNLKENYKDLTELLLSRLTSINNIEIFLVPHVITERYPVEDDYRVCLELSKRFGVSLSPKFKTPSEAKSYISELDLFIGSRMHSTIAAVSSGVPTIPLAYSIKFKGLFESIGYHYFLDLREESNNKIISYITEKIKKPELYTMKLKAMDATNIAQNSLQPYIDAIKSHSDGV